MTEGTACFHLLEVLHKYVMGLMTCIMMTYFSYVVDDDDDVLHDDVLHDDVLMTCCMMDYS